jgi:L-alanine-DL-glutamate epimerase-like enolase superfamily enzyme
MKITDVRCVRLTGTLDYDGPLGESGTARPYDMYPELGPRKRSWPVSDVEAGPPYPVQTTFLFVDTDAGVSGMWAPIEPDDVWIIEHHLRRILIGENPHAVERIWDKMYRTAIHGRKGMTMMAISKVDLALWDLKGKLLGVPVYELLGGPTRTKIRAYASMLGYSVEPERAAQRAREAVAQGYTATKWFFVHTPTDGPAGMRANLALIRAVREAVGPDVDIMFDAWNSWDVPYTQRMADLAAEYRPRWFEEPVMADRIAAYAELRRTVSSTSIVGGEHEYTRWGIKALLDAGAVDVLQPDPKWAGGLTEMVKICALASAYGIPVIPHWGWVASTQLVASQTLTTCPMQEWLIQHHLATVDPFTRPKIEPVNGYVDLPTGPGLGVELDEDAIMSREELSYA